MAKLLTIELNVPVIVKLCEKVVLHVNSLLFRILCLCPVEQMPALLQMPLDDFGKMRTM